METLQLRDDADAATTRYFSLGRHALTAGLSALGIGRGDVVLLPAYICRDLLASVRAVEAEPSFYPVERSLTPGSLPAAPRAKAVIAVNYFGFAQRLAPFRAYCAEHGAALIEDNAHGFLSRDEQGNLLGCRGDLGIVSLRKTFAFPDGAALLLNRKEWIDRLPEPMSCRNDPLSSSYVIKRASRRIQSSTGLPMRRLGEQVARALRRIRTGHPFPTSHPESEFQIPGPAAIHCETRRMLAQIRPPEEGERRRTLYREVQNELRHLDIEPLFGDLPPHAVPYGYPFRAGASTAAAAARVALRRGLDCSRWPDLPTAIEPVAPDFYRNVYWVNFLC